MAERCSHKEEGLDPDEAPGYHWMLLDGLLISINDIFDNFESFMVAMWSLKNRARKFWACEWPLRIPMRAAPRALARALRVMMDKGSQHLTIQEKVQVRVGMLIPNNNTLPTICSSSSTPPSTVLPPPPPPPDAQGT